MSSSRGCAAHVEELSIILALLCAISGCLHSDATCAHRVSEVSARRQRRIDAEMATYNEAMSALQRGNSSEAAQRFFWISHGLWKADMGAYLFEQLGDGSWAYRCDETTRLFALATYRLASLQASGTTNYDRDEAATNFCRALQARPDLILNTAARDAMSPEARVLFDKVKRDPDPIWGPCNVESGVRYDSKPVDAFHFPVHGPQ